MLSRGFIGLLNSFRSFKPFALFIFLRALLLAARRSSSWPQPSSRGEGGGLATPHAGPGPLYAYILYLPLENIESLKTLWYLGILVYRLTKPQRPRGGGLFSSMTH
jgi:hypothetical protein